MPPREVDRFEDLVRLGEHWTARAVQTAARLDVWGAVAAGAATASELAGRLGLSERGTAILCDALVSLGLLRKAAGAYSNTPYAAKHLIPGKPEYDGGLVLMNDATWEEWGKLPEAVKRGAPVLPQRFFHDDPQRTEILLRALYRRALLAAPPMIATLELGANGSLLDVGGGMGGFTTAILRAAPTWRATIFDLPFGAALAREAMAAEGLSDRVSVVAGDFTVDPLPGEHDLILLAAIVHGNSPEENQALVARAARALRPGGRLVVRDYLMTPDLTEPMIGAIFALQMLIANPAGRSYAASEIEGWMRAAGLDDIRVLSPEAMSMTARRPG